MTLVDGPHMRQSSILSLACSSDFEILAALQTVETVCVCEFFTPQPYPLIYAVVNTVHCLLDRKISEKSLQREHNETRTRQKRQKKAKKQWPWNIGGVVAMTSGQGRSSTYLLALTSLYDTPLLRLLSGEKRFVFFWITTVLC